MKWRTSCGYALVALSLWGCGVEGRIGRPVATEADLRVSRPGAADTIVTVSAAPPRSWARVETCWLAIRDDDSNRDDRYPTAFLIVSDSLGTLPEQRPGSPGNYRRIQVRPGDDVPFNAVIVHVTAIRIIGRFCCT